MKSTRPRVAKVRLALLLPLFFFFFFYALKEEFGKNLLLDSIVRVQKKSKYHQPRRHHQGF